MSFEKLEPKNENHRQKGYSHNATICPIEDFIDVLLDFNTPYLQDEIKKEAIRV